MFEEISYDDWMEMTPEEIGKWEVSMLNKFIETINSINITTMRRQVTLFFTTHCY